MLSLTLRQLEYATAVARHGGMTAASEALHVSQPALSVALAQLEAMLDRRLFLRRPGGRLAPTAFGRGWLEQAEVQLAALARLTDPAIVHDEVRLAVFEDIAPACLAPLLARVAQESPDLRIAPQVMSFEALAEALRRGLVDLALTWDLGLESTVTRRVLSHVRPHAVLAAEHPLARRPQLCLHDLADQPLILADQGLSIGHMRALFAQKGLTMQIHHRTASLELMRSFAANGLGIGLSYTNPAAAQSHDGKLIVLCPITDAGAEPLILAHLAQNPPPPGAERLAGFFPACLPESLR